MHRFDAYQIIDFANNNPTDLEVETNSFHFELLLSGSQQGNSRVIVVSRMNNPDYEGETDLHWDEEGISLEGRIILFIS